MEEDKTDIFITRSIFPETAPIFTFLLQPLNEIKSSCFVVLDTNVLLAPYTIGEDDLLDQCRRTYKPLIENHRLIIPGQVAREFAKNRTRKLAELHQQLTRKKQIQQLQKGKYPLLSSIGAYREILRLEEEIDRKLREYQKAVDKVLAHIQGWNWNDPVSLLYSEIFTEDIIVDLPMNEEELIKDLNRRQEYNIPPGYKDSSKKDEGIGDLLIWYTILEIGKMHKQSVLFVSGDEKADWYQKSEGQPLYLRYELIDEFRRHSEGQSFHIVRFSRFLELYGASQKVIDEVRQTEHQSMKQSKLENLKELSKIQFDLMRIDGIIEEKLREIYTFKDKTYVGWQDIGRTDYITTMTGEKIGYLVCELEPPYSSKGLEILYQSSLLTCNSYTLDKFIIFIVVPHLGDIRTVENLILDNKKLLINCSYVLGYCEPDGLFEIINTLPPNLFNTENRPR